MIGLLNALLGGLTRSFIIVLIEVAVFWLYVPVFCHGCEKRSLFTLRTVVLPLVSLLLCVPVAAVRNIGDTLGIRIAVELMYTVIEMGSIFILFKESVSENCMLFTGVTVARSISGNLIPLIRNFLGRDDMESISLFQDYVPLRDWTIYLVLQLAFLGLTAWLFLRDRKNRTESLEWKGALWLTVITLVLKCILAPAARQYQQMSMPLSMVIRILMILLYATVLVAKAGLLGRQRLATELKISEELLHQEKKRYSEMRDSIEIINMRCHDLKRQLEHLSDKLTKEETGALREAIEIYDSNIHTGSEIVDTVLYQKELVTRNNSIQFTWMCDGGAVTFMEPSELYALLSNAIENAIEAVLPLGQPKRVIMLHIRKDGQNAVIETTNYFDAERKTEAGTSKDDKGRHGFGIKSMRYIAGNYGGTVSTSTDGDIFFLTAVIPDRQNEQRKKTK